MRGMGSNFRTDKRHPTAKFVDLALIMWAFGHKGNYRYSSYGEDTKIRCSVDWHWRTIIF